MAPSKSTPIQWTKQVTPSQLHRLVLSERDPRRALSVLDAATASSPPIHPSPSTVSLLVSRLAAAGLLPLATSLFSRSASLLSPGSSLPESALLSLLRAFSRSRRPLAALRLLLSSSPSSSSRSFTATLSALLSNNQLPLARSLIQHMRAVGVAPSTATFNVILKSHCDAAAAGSIDAAVRFFDRIPAPDACSYNTLIDGLCRRDRLPEARDLFSRMLTAGVAPTVVTYTTLVHWLARSGDFDRALELFDEMGRRGLAPNVVTYSSLIDGLCKGGRSGMAVELLGRMVRERKLPNSITYSSVINGLCKEGRINDAMEVLDRMRLQGRKPDAGLFGKIIVGLCDAGRAREAANYFDEMVLAGISPNRVTWSLHVKINNTVVAALCGKGELGRALQVHQSMRARGISTEPSTFHLLVECFCKKGDLEKAGYVVHEMLSERCVPDRETWDVIVGGYWGRKKARKAADQIWNQLGAS